MRSTALPEAPGVYLFYGMNALPLYIGKSRNLRERVGAHFSSDYRSATDLRLSAEIRRIEFEETAGEIGALLRESALVKSMLPAHNHALRRKAEAGVLELPGKPGPPRFHPAAAVEPATARRALRTVHLEARGARDVASSRPRSRAVLERARPRAANRTVLRAPGAPLRRRVRRQESAGGASRTTARGARAVRGAAVAFRRASPASASARFWALAPTSTCYATGAGSAPRATTES